jgi:hypothetical protein
LFPRPLPQRQQEGVQVGLQHADAAAGALPPHAVVAERPGGDPRVNQAGEDPGPLGGLFDGEQGWFALDTGCSFAAAVGCSHTAVNKVVAGREPGRRLLAAVAERLGVNPTWLMAGAGPPYLEPPSEGCAAGLPVARVPLPGAPWVHPELLEAGWPEDTEPLFAPSRYWLVLGHGAPILRERDRGFLQADRLLMETDGARFPEEQDMVDRLCVVRVGGPASVPRLGSVTYQEEDERGPARLEVDTFDLGPDPQTLGREVVYWELPGGVIRKHERPLRIIEYRGHRRAVPLPEPMLEPALSTVRYGDVVAVWVSILRRTYGLPT